MCDGTPITRFRRAIFGEELLDEPVGLERNPFPWSEVRSEVSEAINQDDPTDKPLHPERRRVGAVSIHWLENFKYGWHPPD